MTQENKPNQPGGENIQIKDTSPLRKKILTILKDCQYDFDYGFSKENGSLNIKMVDRNKASYQLEELLTTLPGSGNVEEAEGLRPPDREDTKIDIVHNGMHLSSDYPGHAFAILFAEYLAENNYEHDYNSHHSCTTSWNEVDDPQLHGEDGPEILTTNQVFIKFEKWVKEKYPSFIAGASFQSQQGVGEWLTDIIRSNGSETDISKAAKVLKLFLTDKNK